jgi:type 1 glutamine amidotransferase
MKRLITACRAATVLIFLAVALAASWAGRPTSHAGRLAPRTPKLLVVTVTKGFRHQSIPTAEKVIQEIGDRNHAYTVDYVRSDEEMAAKMTPQALENYDGVVFASTTGDLPLPDREAFLNWIKAGHAFIGIHAATDTFHNYPAFIDMIGGEFKTHGPQVTVECLVEDPRHPATRTLGKSITVYDEIYQFKNYDRAKVHMLLALDKHPNTREPGYYPIAWNRMYGKGRVFYTALGHREDVLEAPWYKQHLLGGIQWALGQARGDAKPQSAAQSSRLKVSSHAAQGLRP